MTDMTNEERIERLTRSRETCVNHPQRTALETLDGEPLCKECCDAWVRAEGRALAEQERYEA